MFTPRRIAQLEPFIRDTAAGLLDRVQDRDSFDLVQEFSFRLPLDVISELVGIPAALRGKVHKLSDRIAARGEDMSVPPDFQDAVIELIGIFSELVRQRLENPGDDVITMLMSTEVEDGDGSMRSLDDGELAFRFLELAFAGHETVAKLIPNGIVALAWYPDERPELVADPAPIPNAVEEMLRWDPPSHYQGRWTMRESKLHDTIIPAGVRVILPTGSAGHDERMYAEPELFDMPPMAAAGASFTWRVRLVVLLLTHDGNNHYPDRRGDRARAGGTDRGRCLPVGGNPPGGARSGRAP